ncbi:hypothetical protein CapIbe_019330, partial [Capra ibex]
GCSDFPEVHPPVSILEDNGQCSGNSSGTPPP